MAEQCFCFVFPGEGLECYCGGNRICSNPIETCSSSANVCGSIIIYVGSSKYMSVLQCTVAKKTLKKQLNFLHEGRIVTFIENGLIICYGVFSHVVTEPSHSRGCMSLRDCVTFNYPGVSSCHSC